MIEMEFIGGPLDGSREMTMEEIKPVLQVPGHLHSYYRLCRREEEELPVLTVLHLSVEEIGKGYRYLWITKESRGKPVAV